MDEDTVYECQIMGEWGIILQTTLLVLAFGVLVYKRHTERPRRAWKIWFLDISKQFISAVVQHFLNLVFAISLSANDSNTDECAWYFVTLVFDSTFGVFVSVLLLSFMEAVMTKGGCENFKSGNYFKEEVTIDPTSKDGKKRVIRIDCTYYSIQLMIWVFAVVSSKFLLYYLQKAMVKPLDEFCSFLFSGLDQLPALKLVIVLLIVPVVCDGCQFWIVDNFLKKKEFGKDEEALKGIFFDDDVNTGKVGLTSQDHNKINFSVELKMGANSPIELDKSFSHLSRLNDDLSIRLDSDSQTTEPNN